MRAAIGEIRILSRRPVGCQIHHRLVATEIRMVEQVEGLDHRDEANVILQRECLRKPQIDALNRISDQRIALHDIVRHAIMVSGVMLDGEP